MLGRSLVERDGGKQKDRARAHSCPGPAGPAPRFRQLCALLAAHALRCAHSPRVPPCAPPLPPHAFSPRCAQMLSHAVLVAFLLDVILLRHGLLRSASTPTRSLCSLLGSPNANGVLFNAFEHKIERDSHRPQAKCPSNTSTPPFFCIQAGSSQKSASRARSRRGATSKDGDGKPDNTLARRRAPTRTHGRRAAASCLARAEQRRRARDLDWWLLQCLLLGLRALVHATTTLANTERAVRRRAAGDGSGLVVVPAGSVVWHP
jgi:hypothetical protein